MSDGGKIRKENSKKAVPSTIGGSDGEHTEKDFKIKGHLPSAFINLRLTNLKVYNTRTAKGAFHGTVESFELKNPGKNKHPVFFKCLFDEDGKYEYINSRSLYNLLDNPPEPV